MGYNTTLMILNDRLGDFEKNPKSLVDAVREEMGDGSPRWSSGVHVMKTAHADVPRLYFTHRNSITELSQFAKDTLDLAVNGQDFQQRIIDSEIAEARLMLDNLEARIAKMRAEA
jgi:hypothetical protein